MKIASGLLALSIMLLCCATARAQDDGGVSYDARGHELLESIYVPALPNAPFSLTLAAEWTRPLLTGGTFTIVNARPIKRDTAGRIYQERHLMEPKGSNVKSPLSWIQIEDPVAGVYFECNPHRKVCEEHSLPPQPVTSPAPAQTSSGPLRNGRGYRTHEDKGTDTVAGLPVHAYRDTIVINAGTQGNDSPITYVRDVRFSNELGFNLSSVLQSPTVGEQRFRVMEVTTSEPEPRFFQPPEGYRVVDVREQDAQQPK